jgi:transposase
MSREFKTVDYEQALDSTVKIRECLSPNHLARFIVQIIAMLDLSRIYGRYAGCGGEPIAPEVLLGLLVYGYATGIFSSRKLEQLTYESIPFRFLAGGLHPDHDTIAHFRKSFLPEIKELFVQVLRIAQEAGVLKLGNISLDGSKIHADASKSKAISYKRLLELEEKRYTEVEELIALSETPGQLPEQLDLEEEISLRQEHLTNLAQAKDVIEARAQERYQTEQAEYEVKLKQRQEKAERTGKQPRGRAPKPPTPGPRDNDQYNFTDPDSRIMKNSNNHGFDQHYNVQVAVDQETLLIVANTLSNHPNDQAEALPTLGSVPQELGTPDAAALDNGYFSEDNIADIQACGIEPYIATGRDTHHRSWRQYFAQQEEPPANDASTTVKMAYKLQTQVGKAIYRLRKCTVEPVIGIIKEVLGFRQFSLRGLAAATGEWCLVCLAFNIKRLHVLLSA